MDVVECRRIDDAEDVAGRLADLCGATLDAASSRASATDDNLDDVVRLRLSDGRVCDVLSEVPEMIVPTCEMLSLGVTSASRTVGKLCRCREFLGRELPSFVLFRRSVSLEGFFNVAFSLRGTLEPYTYSSVLSMLSLAPASEALELRL